MPRVVIGSHNEGKIRELRRLLQEVAPHWTVLGSKDYPGLPDVAETELSFAGNALLKARSACQHTGEVAFGDDSGLCVDVMNGMPGILSARWSGVFAQRHADDDSNIALLLSQLADLPDEARRARQHCTVAIVWPDGREVTVTGECHGVLARERHGTGGFGYDSVFILDGETRTMAEMTKEEKDAVSHRGIALRLAVAELLKGSPE